MNREKCIFDQMGGTYIQAGDYLIPDITCKLDEQLEWIGKYGFLRRDYLKNHRNSRYQVMLMQGTLGEHLLEVDKAELEKAKAEIKRLKKELEKRNEKMKEKEVLWMVGCMILVLIVMMFHIVF